MQHFTKRRYNNSCCGPFYYSAYLETLLAYGNEAAETHLRNAFWYRDTGDLGVSDTTAVVTPSTNKGFLVRCTE